MFLNSIPLSTWSYVKVGNTLKLTEKMITLYRPMRNLVMAFDLHQIICLLPLLWTIFKTKKIMSLKVTNEHFFPSKCKFL